MSRGFWDKLAKPVFTLAPMANVTDAAFRATIARFGKPDVMWTEFVSADGLCSPAKEKLLPDLWFSQKERPIVAQIFGSNPETIREAAKLVKRLKFDGIDINMGCPDRAVERQGAGASLMKNPKLMNKLVLAAREGAGNLPVSVKTRIGYNKIDWLEWLPELLSVSPAAIVFHLRTRKEMSKVPAHWEEMKKIVAFVHEITAPTVRPYLLGNGDVTNLAEAKQKIAETGTDGIMIGRGIFGNPWLFNRKTSLEEVPVKKRLAAMIEHTRKFEQKFFGIKRFEIMKKHYKAYVNNFAGAKELRLNLMENAKSAQDVERIVRGYLKSSVD